MICDGVYNNDCLKTFFFLDSMLLPIWNHPLDGPSGTNSPAPQATACAHSGDIALTYVCNFLYYVKD